MHGTSTHPGWRLAPLVVAAVLAAPLVGVVVPAAAGSAAVPRPAWAPWSQARPAPPMAPHSNPIQRTGSAVEHSSRAGPESPAALGASANWAGQVETGSQYSGISADWKVPTVGPTSADDYSGTWIGIDGFDDGSIIQTGTAQESTPTGAVDFAWYELYPLPAEELGPVAPGDQMSASIIEDSPGTWTLTIDDVSSQQGASGPLVRRPGHLGRVDRRAGRRSTRRSPPWPRSGA